MLNIDSHTKYFRYNKLKKRIVFIAVKYGRLMINSPAQKMHLVDIFWKYVEIKL